MRSTMTLVLSVMVVLVLGLATWGVAKLFGEFCDELTRQMMVSVGQALKEAAPVIKEEILRETIVEDFGPVIVTSVVGVSASGGGPAPFTGLGTDAGWREFFSDLIPELKHVPSPLEVPDPDRPFQVNRIGM